MMSIDPDDRYPSMNKVIQKLSEIAFDDIEIARESYLRCLDYKNDSSDFITAFYDAFINTSKQAEEKFKDKERREQQYKKLKASILHLFSFAKENIGCDNSEEPNALSWIAERHRAEGIYEYSYNEFKEALIKTVLEFDEYCKIGSSKNKIISAWKNVLEPGIRYMQRKPWDKANS